MSLPIYVPPNATSVTQQQLASAVSLCVKNTQLTTSGSASGVPQLDTRGALTLQASINYGTRYDVKSAAIGAVGNGVTDDAPVINAFLSAHSSGGYTLYFPSGTYILGSAIYLASCSNVLLCGEGVLMAKSTNTSDLIDMRVCNHCIIRDLTVDGNLTAGPAILLSGTSSGGNLSNSFINLQIRNTAQNQAGILLDGQTSATDGTLVQNCEFGNIGGVAVSQNCVIRSRIEGNHFTGSNLEAITVDHQTDYCIIANNTVCNAQGGVGGIGLDNSRWCTITGNTILGCGVPGITFQNNYLTSQLFNTPYNSLCNTISGNTIAFNQTGVKLNVISQANNTICDRTVISGNTLWSNTTGINVQPGCLRTIVANNSDADVANMVWSNLDSSNIRDTVFQTGTGALTATSASLSSLNLQGGINGNRIQQINLNGAPIPSYADQTTQFLVVGGATDVATCLAVVCNNKCTGYITTDSSSPDNLNIGLDGNGSIAFRTGMNIGASNIATSGTTQMVISQSTITCYEPLKLGSGVHLQSVQASSWTASSTNPGGYVLGSSNVVGSLASCSVTGSDTCGTVTIIPNGSIMSTSSGPFITLYFINSFVNPMAVFSAANTTAATLSGVYITSTSSTLVMSIASGSSFISQQTYKWNYHVTDLASS